MQFLYFELPLELSELQVGLYSNRNFSRDPTWIIQVTDVKNLRKISKLVGQLDRVGPLT